MNRRILSPRSSITDATLPASYCSGGQQALPGREMRTFTSSGCIGVCVGGMNISNLNQPPTTHLPSAFGSILEETARRDGSPGFGIISCTAGTSGRPIATEHRAEAKNSCSSNLFLQDLRASRLAFQQTDHLRVTNSRCGVAAKGKKRQCGDDHYQSSSKALSRPRIEPSSAHPSTIGVMSSATSSVVMHTRLLNDDADHRILPLETHGIPSSTSSAHLHSIQFDERYMYLLDYLRESSKGKK